MLYNLRGMALYGKIKSYFIATPVKYISYITKGEKGKIIYTTVEPRYKEGGYNKTLL